MSRRLRGAALVLAMVALVAAALVGSGLSGQGHGRMHTAPRSDPVTAAERVLLGEVRVAQLGPAAQPAAAPVSSSGRPYLGRFLVTCYVLRGITKSGKPVSRDVVAVDPKLIPLGTKIGIQGIGPRIAADTGRLIRGRHLDIWMPDYEDCIEFGRKHRDVYLISPAPTGA